MSVFGNDIHKHATDTLKQTVQRQSWLRGRIAQILVFMNGLILTFTAFATLNVFIHQTASEGIALTTQETREYFTERFSNLEKAVNAASAATLRNGEGTSDAFIDSFKASFTYNEYFTRIYWLQQVSDGQYAAHALTDVKPDESNSFDAPSIHKFVATALDKASDKNQVLVEYGGFSVTSGKNDYPMIIARPVDRGNGRVDIVYGLTTVTKAVSLQFLENRKNLDELSILFGDKNVGLFKYRREGMRRDATLPPEYMKVFEVPLADKMVSLKIYASLGERERFLNKIPYLLLFFGLTLTLIGTMYVRNNQRQSLRLATINMELAQKNIDLNREVTEREKLNQALRRAEKENRAVIDAVSDIIFETSTDGEILFLNETWQKITGFSAERSLGRNLFDLFYMQDQAEQRSNFAQLVKGKKQGYRAFTRLRTADGNFRAVELAVSMIRQDDNKDLRVVGTITDVEERRRTERALSEAEKKYRAIVENAASGIYQVTPEGHYLSANPAMANILGYESTDEILRDVRNVNTDIYYNARERERQLRDAVRAVGVTVECQVRRKDGKIIWVQENLRAVKDEQDQLIYFEGSMDDITQRKETEIALRAAKVDSDLANRAKSEFLANMSHELRTPLNAIIGFSEIIRNQAFGEVGRVEYLDYARDINESGKRLLQVINEILDVSRIEAGERQLNESVVDLQKMVLSSLEMLGQKIESNNMIVSNYINADTAKIIGEAHAIKQMLTNILSNAVKFTPSGGRITINSDIDDFGQLHVSVTDTGIGLTDEEIEKALSPFGQVNTALNKSESGTGLGLTLVQSLMALHGGSFELFSQKGVGTTASLIFPPKRITLSQSRTPERV